MASGRNEVVVGLRAELVDLQSREIIKSKNFSKRVLAPSKDAQSAVKSFNQAVRDLLEDMISWLP